MEVYNSVLLIHVALVVLFLKSVLAWPARDAPLLTYTIPEARELKRALGYNEDSYLNFTEIVTKYGYQHEEHNVLTKDGYILTVFRVLPKCNQPARLYPVLLMHGLFDSSDVWIVPGTKLGLAYILSSNCYDVWAANHRGNVYSRKHKTLNADKDVKYWDYSFDEHGNYDVPALIDYVLGITNKPKVFYIGHSQGTTNFIIMSSLRPEYNQKVQLSILLAPIAWMANIYSPIVKLISANVKDLKTILDSAGLREVLAKHQLLHFLSEMLCHFAPDATCGTILSLAAGQEKGTIKNEVLAVGFGHLLSGTSTKTLAHFAQLITSDKFKRYDEGTEGNLKRYHLTKPPEYDVSKVVSPVVLVSAANDWVSSLKDVDILSKRLSNVLENYIVPVKEWSHLNHIWDERAMSYIIPKILDYFETYNF